MKIWRIVKDLFIGFWRYGFISLLQVVLEHWFLTFIIIAVITYLSVNPKTTIYVWVIIGLFAVFCVIKALVEIVIELKNYIKSTNDEEKRFAIQQIGGKFFDIFLCVVGIFQSLKILQHSSRVVKSSSSVVSILDDVANAVSRGIKHFTK